MESKSISSVQVFESKHLLRKLYVTKPDSDYENLVSLFANLQQIDPDNETGIKNKANLFSSLTADTFQFILSSQFFPRSAYDLCHTKEGVIKQFFDKILEEKVSNQHLQMKKLKISNMNNNDKKKLAGEFDLIQSFVNGNNSDLKEYDKTISIGSLYNAVDKEISVIQEKNRELLGKVNRSNPLVSCFFDLMKENIPINIKKEDNLLRDVSFESKTFQIWRSFQKKRQEMVNMKGKPGLSTFKEEMQQTHVDDIVCVICNDGDYEENDLIVYCSSCQLTAHQNCYGIQNIPDEDWICNLCLIYTKDEIDNVECCLCSVGGGAMKLSQLKKNSSYYKKICRLRGNSLYRIDSKNTLPGDNLNLLGNNNSANSIDQKLPKEENGKYNNGSSKVIDENKMNIDEEIICCKGIVHENNKSNKEKAFEESNRSSSEVKMESFTKKNKLKKSNKSSQQLTNTEIFELYKAQVRKKSVDYVWVHVSCALWNPDIIIDDFMNKEDIKNIDSIDITRFNEKCSICDKTGYGPCIKCENDKCDLSFHVECARINKYHLECHSAGEDLKYFIYCQIHRPLQFLKLLEIKNYKKKEEIFKYANYIEKHVTNFSKAKGRSILATKYIPLEKSRYNKNLLCKKRKKVLETNTNNSVELSKSQSNRVLAKIKEIYSKLIHRDILVKYKEKTDSYDITKKDISSTHYISFKDIFDKEIFPWYMISFPDVTPKAAYIHFGKICNDEKQFNSLMFGISDKGTKCNKKEEKKKENTKSTKIFETRKVNPQAQDQDQDEFNTLYCYCKRKYDTGSFMIACSNEVDCPNKGWFHPECVEELKGMKKEEIESEDFNFTCKDCKQLQIEIEDNDEYNENFMDKLSEIKEHSKEYASDVPIDVINLRGESSEEEDESSVISNKVFSNNTISKKAQSYKSLVLSHISNSKKSDRKNKQITNDLSSPKHTENSIKEDNNESE